MSYNRRLFLNLIGLSFHSITLSQFTCNNMQSNQKRSMIQKHKLAKFFHLITILIEFILFTSPCSADDSNKQIQVQGQYVKDLINLAESILNHPEKQNKNPEYPPLISTAFISSIESFQQKRIELVKNQQVQLSYPFLQYLSDIKIKESLITDEIRDKFLSSRLHFQEHPEDYSNMSICRVQDSEMSTKILGSLQLSSKNQKHEMYAILQDKDILDKTGLKRILCNVLGQRTKYISLQNLGICLKKKRKNQFTQSTQFRQSFSMPIKQDQKIFIFEWQNEVMISTYNQLYLLKDGKTELFAKIKHASQGEKNSSLVQIAQKVINIQPLKFGILVQYETLIGLYSDSLPFEYLDNSILVSSMRYMINVLNNQGIYRLTKGNKILNVKVKQNASHQHGYQIFLLVQSLGVIQFIYGSYGQINQYHVPYSNLKSFQVFDQTLEIVFEQTHNKQARTYVAEIYLNKTDKINPYIMINRFYEHSRQIRSMQYWDGWLYFIGYYKLIQVSISLNSGPKEVTIQGPSINSQILISQNISQFPYKIPLISRSKLFHFLEHYSTPLTDLFVNVNDNQIQIIQTKRQNQRILCKNNQDFDIRVNMIGSCCRMQFECESEQIWKLCKYQHNIRVTMINESSNKIFSMMRYLIIVLIVISIMALIMLIKNIKNNTKVISKLASIRKKFQDKYKQMQMKHQKKSGKGEKLQRDDYPEKEDFTQREQQLHEQQNNGGSSDLKKQNDQKEEQKQQNKKKNTSEQLQNSQNVKNQQQRNVDSQAQLNDFKQIQDQGQK